MTRVIRRITTPTVRIRITITITITSNLNYFNKEKLYSTPPPPPLQSELLRSNSNVTMTFRFPSSNGELKSSATNTQRSISHDEDLLLSDCDRVRPLRYCCFFEPPCPQGNVRPPVSESTHNIDIADHSGLTQVPPLFGSIQKNDA